MATLTIRGLDDGVKERLRVRAARRGRSMEAEVRAILAGAVAEPGPVGGLATRIRHRFADLGGAEIVAERRSDAPRPAMFEL